MKTLILVLDKLESMSIDYILTELFLHLHDKNEFKHVDENHLLSKYYSFF